MDRMISRSRSATAKLVATSALCLLAVLAFAVSAAQARPKAAAQTHASCATFFTGAQIGAAIGGEVSIQFLGAQRLAEGQIGDYIGPISQCGYGWGNPPTGNPEPLDNKVPAIWAVAWGLTAKDWRETVAREKSEPFEGSGPWTFKTLQLGSGSKAFVVTSTGLEPPASYVYALTRNGGLIWLDIWPAKVSAISSLVQDALRRNPTF